MRSIHLVVIFVFFFSCKLDKTKKELKTENTETKEIIKDTLKPRKYTMCSEEDLNLSFPKLDFFKKIVRAENIKINQFRNSLLKTFNALFEEEYIKCIVPYSSEDFLVYDIYYKSGSDCGAIYNNIIRTNKNCRNLKDTQGYYRDFFKTGLVFVLNTKQDKITLLTFNPFIDNSMSDKLQKSFSKSKTSFEKVFMSTGICTAKSLLVE